MARAVVASAVLAVSVSAPLQAEELSPAELRGKRIYNEGVSNSGQALRARLGQGNTDVPASSVPCARCHGSDGRGRSEGDIPPSDITWTYLTRPSGHQHEDGREHPAFDDASLARSITDGVDPAGNALDKVMPRYTMAELDLADLAAYVKRLEADLDPGLTAATLRLGTLLPVEGQFDGVGRSMRGVLEAYFDDRNAKGGIHGRRIELVVGDYGPDRTNTLWNARDLVERGNVFALVSPFVIGFEEKMGEFVREKRIPAVGPYAFWAEAHADASPYRFHLQAGLVQQAQVLMKYADDKLGLEDPHVAVVHPQRGAYAEVIERLTGQAKQLGWRAPIARAYKPGDPTSTVDALQAQDVALVFFLGPGPALRELTEQAERVGWRPYIVSPGIIAGDTVFDIAAGFGDRVFLAFSSLPVDHTAAGVAEFEGLRERHELDFRHGDAQVSAFTAAKVTVEALERAGPNLSRERLVAALEGLDGFETGLMPAISYSSTRRIGALGGYVVAVDVAGKRFKPVSEWIPLEP